MFHQTVEENLNAPIVPNCSEEHEFENCNKKESKICSNCGGNNSAGYKGCLEFLKNKIKEYSYRQKLSYAEVTKQFKTNVKCTMEQQTKVNNEDHIVTKVIEKVQTQSIGNEGTLVEKVVEKIQSQAKQLVKSSLLTIS